MRISYWSSNVCSSDLRPGARVGELLPVFADRCACPGRGRRLVWIGSAGGRKGETHDDTDISCRRSCAGAHGYPDEIGRASCRERVCQYVYISLSAGLFTTFMYLFFLLFLYFQL